MFSHLANSNNRFSTDLAVLSLTRQPLNKLMLAHYADNHKGMVVGIDVTKVEDFTSRETCFIPAQYGSVVYTETMPTFNAMDEANEITDFFDHALFESRQRALLFKDSAWAMEEEVRVVKSLRSYEENFSVEYIEGRPLYLYSLPQDAIAEVYLGCRAPILPATAGDFGVWKMLKNAFNKHPHCKVRQIAVEAGSWNVYHKDLEQGTYDGLWDLHHEGLKCE